MKYQPSFGGKLIAFLDLNTVKDYLYKRQVDCHVNNLYNTCFWALVRSGMTMEDAEKKLCVNNNREPTHL